MAACADAQYFTGGIVTVAAGFYHSAAVTEHGGLYTCGTGRHVNLPIGLVHGDMLDMPVPTLWRRTSCRARCYSLQREHVASETTQSSASTSPAVWPAPCELFPSGACAVQPEAPAGCPVFQASEHRPWRAAPSTVAATIDDWRAEGYNVSTIAPAFLASFAAAYPTCPDFAGIWKTLKRSTAGSDLYPDFHIEPDTQLLYRHVAGGEMDIYRVCVPTSARGEVLKEMHDAPTSGHFGVDRTYVRAAKDFYWRSLRQDVEAYVSSCAECQRNKA